MFQTYQQTLYLSYVWEIQEEKIFFGEHSQMSAFSIKNSGWIVDVKIPLVCGMKFMSNLDYSE